MKFIVIIIWAFIHAVAAFAQVEAVGFSMTDVRALSLREAIAMTLANNVEIELTRQQTRLLQFDVQAARGSYDTRFALSSNDERQRSPGTNIFNSGNNLSILNRTQTNAVQIEKVLPRWGTKVGAEFAATRLTTNDPFNTFRTSQQTALTFSLTQPLARGRGFDETRRQVEVAKRNLSLSDQQFRQRVIETVANVQRTYWDLAFALKNLQVQQDALRDTELQLAHIKRLIAEGRLAPVEAVAIEGQQARFEKDRFDAIAIVARAENELKRLVTADERMPLWQQTILPTDAIELAVPALELPEAMRAALQQRAELQQQQTATASNAIQQRAAREQLKPQIDLTVNYGLNGFAGRPPANANAGFGGDLLAPVIARLNLITGNELPPLVLSPAAPPPRLLVGGFGQSLGNLLHNRFNTFRVGVTINLPLRNTTAKAELGRALAQADKLAIEKRQLVQTIHVEVRNALQDLRIAEAKLKASTTARNAAAPALDSERRKLDAGHATASVNLVLERQKQLAQAQRDEWQARVELNKTISELQRVMGATLEQNGIALFPLSAPAFASIKAEENRARSAQTAPARPESHRDRAW